MADILNLLRLYNVKNEEIIERDNRICFGEHSWPKHVKTNYLMWRSDNGAPKEYYTLECLLFLLKHVTLTHSAYVRKAVAENKQVVRRPDRKDLLAYLNGEAATSVNIDKNAAVDILRPVKRARDGSVESMSKRRKLEDVQEQRMKQRLAARLDTPKQASVTADNIKSLSEAMTVETIAAIKVKRLAKKRTTIKRHDDIDICSKRRVMMDLDDDNIKDILSRERPGRSRNTILQSTGKMFAQDVFAILQSVKEKEESKQRSPASASVMTYKPTPIQTHSHQAPAPRVIPMAKVYNRYDQERFIRQEKEANGFKINTMATYHKMSLKSVTEGDQHKKMPSPQTPHPEPILSPGLQLSSQPIKRTSRTPIIIIPGANTSLITMYNAKDILQDFKFVTTEDKKKQGATRENDIFLQRRKNGALTVPYRVTDNPQKLAPGDWDRVVAVFVMGPTWQFKGWPWKGNPVEIFSKVCAFHLKYDEMLLEKNVAGWDVSIIQLSRSKRHLDRAALMVFWEKLDKHLMKNKPHLRF
ncbi:parafibromin-like [Homalodisca vitripennis]|uniref:parafibromin-like n=1 Tax=Homalodisca vitripennis TaxID=197043 RepID=UPI001EEB57FE|nr:parafibromin-like [Homalodisca vitripennis]